MYLICGIVSLTILSLIALLFLFQGCKPAPSNISIPETAQPTETIEALPKLSSGVKPVHEIIQPMKIFNTPPELLGKVKSVAWIREGVLSLENQVYFLGYSSVSMLDGIAPSQKITIPDLSTNQGSSLPDIELNPIDGLIYVSDRYGNAIHVIRDTTIITTITGIFESPRQIVVDEDTGTVNVFYISQRSGEVESYVTVISGTKVITDIHISHKVQVARYNPIDGHIYLAGSTRAPRIDEEGVLMLMDGYQITTVIRPLSKPDISIEDMVINPKTGDIHILFATKALMWDRVGEVHSIDLYKAGYRSLRCITIDPKRGLTYVCSWMGPQSYVLVVDKDELVAEIPVAYWPEVATFSSRHDYLYVGHYDPTYLSVIRGTELITTLDIIGVGTTNVIVDEERDLIYTANADDATVNVFGFPKEISTTTSQTFLPIIR